MPIRTITFDWGDTLAANHGQPYDFNLHRAFGGLAEDLTRMGGATGPGWVEDCLEELRRVWMVTIDIAGNPDHKEFDWQTLLAGWIASAGVAADHPDLPAARDRYGRILTDTVVVFGDTLPTLRTLHQAGYRLGILSHVPWPGCFCRDWFHRWSLAPVLDFYSLSSEIGWIKPNPRHFAHAMELAGCQADEILHVGDHPLRDIQGARACGLRTCLRVTQGIYPEADLAGCDPDLVIATMADLPAAIATLG